MHIQGSRKTTCHQLEDGVMAEGIVVVLVLVVGEDAVDAGADHFQEGVVDLVGIAAVVEGGGEGMGQTDVGISRLRGSWTPSSQPTRKRNRSE